MNTAYIVQQGGMLRREGERLVVWSAGRAVSKLPVTGLEQLVVVGNLALTAEAIDLLVGHGVDTVLLTSTGRYRARIGRAPAGNVRLRLAQYALAGDATRCLCFAAQVVRAKVWNQRAFLQRIARRSEDPRLPPAIDALAAALEGLSTATTLDEVRGYEGAAAASYFRAFGASLIGAGFSFDVRRRRPPPDPVNALLSLGYTLLLRRVESAAAVVGLDPFLGVLHAPEAGRPSLALDLVEPFRAPVVDALVVAALNKGAIRPDHFEGEGPEAPVSITREGLRTFVGLFARRLEREIRDPALGRRLPFREVLVEQARRFARFVSGAPSFEGFTAR